MLALQVFRPQTGLLGDARQHAGPDLVAVMKGPSRSARTRKARACAWARAASDVSPYASPPGVDDLSQEATILFLLDLHAVTEQHLRTIA